MEQCMSRTQLDESIDAIESFTITEFKERARELIDLVEDHKAVAILRHKMPDRTHFRRRLRGVYEAEARTS
jgi:hypothetical protein